MQTTITLVNKLNRKDSSNNVDEWFKTVIPDCEYKRVSSHSVTEKTTVIGNSFTVLVPFTGKFLDYSQWKQLTDRSDKYTIRPGDYIFLGELDEEVSANNITTLYNTYKDSALQVKSYNQVVEALWTNYELKVEGV
jgi:hypothetical protein